MTLKKDVIFVAIITAIIFTMTVQLQSIKAAPITINVKKQKIQARDLLMKK